MVQYGMKQYSIVWYGTVWYAMLCYAMLCYAMLCYAMLCYAMLCYAMLCYAMVCYGMLWYAMVRYSIVSLRQECAQQLWRFETAGGKRENCRSRPESFLGTRLAPASACHSLRSRHRMCSHPPLTVRRVYLPLDQQGLETAQYLDSEFDRIGLLSFICLIGNRRCP